MGELVVHPLTPARTCVATCALCVPAERRDGAVVVANSEGDDDYVIRRNSPWLQPCEFTIRIRPGATFSFINPRARELRDRGERHPSRAGSALRHDLFL